MNNNQTNNTIENEHAWVHEQMAAALVDGLSADERARFDAHLKTCNACAAEFSNLQNADTNLASLFAASHPRAGFEDRIIQNLRVARQRMIPPAVYRAATGIAAALLLGGFGYVATTMIERGDPRVKVASNLREIDQATLLYTNENKGIYPRTVAPPSLMAERLRHDLNGRVKAQSGRADGDVDRNDRDYFWDGQAHSGDRSAFGESREAKDGFLVPKVVAQVPELKAGNTAVTNGGELQKDGRGALSISGQNMYRGVVAPTGGSVGQEGTTIAGTVVSGKEVAANGWFKPAELGSAGAGDKIAQENAATTSPPAQQATEPPGAAYFATGAGASGAAGPAPATQAGASRKVIYSANMEFEVDSFESAYVRVVTLAKEAGGYVGSTDSEKLPNGKVKGTVALRIPPDKLDTLVLQLRGVGELKSQKLNAEDISKAYTDLESQLKAARAMEERLLDIIKTGKGQIKDLLAAEKELGEWRTKIEKFTGEMKYYDNLVAMATLNLTLYEKDIKTPATAIETETIDTGVETDDVEKSRAEALKAIETAKGRVIQSDLKRFDAGQFAATIVADVAQDKAGPLVDRLKQLGKVARLDIQRKQTNDPNAATGPSVRVEKRETRINISLYNLANVAPRQTTTMSIAADDVEAAYRVIIERATKVGGRVVTSNLNRSKPEQTTGTISLEIPSAQAEAIANELKGAGEVMNLAATENPDTNNVTTAKRGFQIQLIAAASVAPRETATLQLAAANVPEARQKILDAAGAANVRVLSSQMNESDQQNVNATLDLEVRREKLAEFEKAIAGAGDTVSRNVSRSSDTQNTIDSKVRMQMTLVSADRLPPRETTTLAIELGDVEKAIAAMQSAASGAGGKVVDSNLSRQRDGQTVGRVVVEVPLSKSSEVVSAAKSQGALRVFETGSNAQVPAGPLARARIEITFGTADTIVEPGQGFWSAIRQGLSTSIAGLLWSLKLIVAGLLFVVPWIAAILIGWKLWRRVRPKPVA